MDLSGSADFPALSPADKAELNRFIKAQNQQMELNKVIGELTDTCWKKCVTGKVSSPTLDSREESCTKNCVSRWMELQGSVTKGLMESEKKMKGF